VKNITITLDESTAQWVRRTAGEHGKSVSRLISEILAEKRVESREYQEAMRAFLGRKLTPISTPGDRLPTRDEIYDRVRIR
jgi:acid phosphatase family membrane protein YuiD